MSQVFNTFRRLSENARRINGETYEELVAKLQPQEKLFGYYEIDYYGLSMYQKVVRLDSPLEYHEFELLALYGYYKQLGFYAMPVFDL